MTYHIEGCDPQLISFISQQTNCEPPSNLQSALATSANTVTKTPKHIFVQLVHAWMRFTNIGNEVRCKTTIIIVKLSNITS